jgi:hypothetical protein
MHDITTGEFVNVGVALYSSEARYASALCRSTFGRLSKTFPGMVGDAFKSLMRFVQSRIEEIGDGLKQELPLNGRPASVIDVAHAVLPPDDSSLQWSPPGSGLSENSQTLRRFSTGWSLATTNALSKSAAAMKKSGANIARLESRQVLKHLQPKKITVQMTRSNFSTRGRTACGTAWSPCRST